ncbi:MAG: AraC family transcriptional regulator, partial [Bacteroidota bacterium]
ADILFFNYNDMSSVLLIFFVHAVVFSFLLLKKGIADNQHESMWLAAFILLGGLYICPFMLGYAGWYSTNPYREFMFFFPFQQLFLIGPVFYFYILTLLNRNFKFVRWDWLHFFPALLYMLYSLIVFITDKLILDELYFYADNKDKDLDVWYQVAGLISMLFYLILSLRHYLSYRKLSLEEVSYADEISFKWIQYFTLALGIILILRILFFILNPEWGEFGRKFWYYLCFSILLMYISISGYAHTLKTSLKFAPIILKDWKQPKQGKVQESKEAWVEAEALPEWKEKISHIFESASVYQNPSLTITDLSRLLNTNRNIVSKVINQEFHMNFNDFVNTKRVEAVIEKLQKGEHTKNTLLGIAMDCGFNSKTTFNRAFKKYTALTPKQYITTHEL